MSFIILDQLPFVGMSYEFVGETPGAPVSAYIVKAKPGQGPPLQPALRTQSCPTTAPQLPRPEAPVAANWRVEVISS
jgi:hypothetical protein